MLSSLYLYAVNAVRSLRDDEEGIGTLELVLIVAVLIAVVLVFRREIIAFLETLMNNVEKKSEDVFK
ncbi:Flp1 family type IVb pilin [Cohnella terricola]|uniref:Putative Flagellin Flp1-like domain-containing protein n=1 Tax=Cohnella terricola TaxID=1289167 RepID=A0A559JED0_9BACL|nr:Flp1 family type IVb pilin [Cohnella terricola]TVX98220.1 hypothetical protein FPZ45_16095 [Cohnella terricola]